MATCSSILAGKSHGQKSLVGYSPWSCIESQTWLSNQTKGASQNFFFFLAMSYSLWDHNSLTRDWTQACNSESVESYPLDHQGIPSKSNLRNGPLSAPVSPFYRATTSSFTMLPPSLFRRWKHTQHTAPPEDQQCRQSSPETAANVHGALACSPFPFWKDLCLGAGT